MDKICFPQGSLLLCVIYRPGHNFIEFWSRLGNCIEVGLDISCYMATDGDLNETLLSNRNYYRNGILPPKNIKLCNCCIHQSLKSITLLDPIIVC